MLFEADSSTQTKFKIHIMIQLLHKTLLLLQKKLFLIQQLLKILQPLAGEYLDTKSKNEIDSIRNEIYARHGYIFKMEQYYNYFYKKSWYKPIEPDMDKVYDEFNSIEKQNREILVEYQNLG